MIRVGRIKWDEDDIHAIDTMRLQVLTLDSQRVLGLISLDEYNRALSDIVARVDALEVKYGIREHIPGPGLDARSDR